MSEGNASLDDGWFELWKGGMLSGEWEAYKAGVKAPKPSSAPPAEPKPGDKMPDGTIYAGVSPDTGNVMYTTPADAPLSMKWKQAMGYASRLDSHGHQDWRVPTGGELNVLFQNRDAIGGFNETGLAPAGWYWSSSQDDFFNAWEQDFSDGLQNPYYRLGHSSLRCVR